jgi:hypothetical protein
MAVGWNESSSPTDAIKAPSLNLTKWATYVAGALGVLTTGFGIGAELHTADDAQQSIAVQDEDIVGFNDDQRLIILVALIAVVGIVCCCSRASPHQGGLPRLVG